MEYDQNNTILNLDSQFPFFFHYLSFFMIVMKNEIKLRVYIRIFMANCKVTTDIVIWWARFDYILKDRGSRQKGRFNSTVRNSRTRYEGNEYICTSIKRRTHKGPAVTTYLECRAQLRCTVGKLEVGGGGGVQYAGGNGGSCLWRWLCRWLWE